MRVEVSSLWAAVLYDHNDHSIMAVCLGATSEDAGRKARAYLKDCIMEDDEAVAEDVTVSAPLPIVGVPVHTLVFVSDAHNESAPKFAAEKSSAIVKTPVMLVPSLSDALP